MSLFCICNYGAHLRRKLSESPWGASIGEESVKQATGKHGRTVASFAWSLLECTPLWGVGERVSTLQCTAPTHSNKSCNPWYCKTNMGADLIKTWQNPFIWAHLCLVTHSTQSHTPLMTNTEMVESHWWIRTGGSGLGGVPSSILMFEGWYLSLNLIISIPNNLTIFSVTGQFAKSGVTALRKYSAFFKKKWDLHIQ